MFDTRHLRASALGFGLPFQLSLPFADGSLDIEDAAQALGAYRAPDAVVVVVPAPAAAGGGGTEERRRRRPARIQLPPARHEVIAAPATFTVKGQLAGPVVTQVATATTVGFGVVGQGAITALASWGAPGAWAFAAPPAAGRLTVDVIAQLDAEERMADDDDDWVVAQVAA
jgi:hypothetical protein